MNQEQNFGMAVILSGPSGVGKTTIYNAIKCNQERDEFNLNDFHFSVSCTTRARRHDEIDGMSYHFLTDEQFQKHLDADDFLEHAEVHGANYGTLKTELKHIKSGKDVIFDIDVQGMRKIKAKLADDPFYGPRLITIFIMPPSLAELEKRLRGRRTDSEEAIIRRLANAVREMEAWKEYDYIVINKDSNESAYEIQKIMAAAHYRTQLITEETWNNERAY